MNRQLPRTGVVVAASCFVLCAAPPEATAVSNGFGVNIVENTHVTLRGTRATIETPQLSDIKVSQNNALLERVATERDGTTSTGIIQVGFGKTERHFQLRLWQQRWSSGLL